MHIICSVLLVYMKCQHVMLGPVSFQVYFLKKDEKQKQ